MNPFKVLGIVLSPFIVVVSTFTLGAGIEEGPRWLIGLAGIGIAWLAWAFWDMP